MALTWTGGDCGVLAAARSRRRGRTVQASAVGQL